MHKIDSFQVTVDHTQKQEGQGGLVSLVWVNMGS